MGGTTREGSSVRPRAHSLTSKLIFFTVTQGMTSREDLGFRFTRRQESSRRCGAGRNASLARETRGRRRWSLSRGLRERTAPPDVGDGSAGIFGSTKRAESLVPVKSKDGRACVAGKGVDAHGVRSAIGSGLMRLGGPALMYMGQFNRGLRSDVPRRMPRFPRSSSTLALWGALPPSPLQAASFHPCIVVASRRSALKVRPNHRPHKKGYVK